MVSWVFYYLNVMGIIMIISDNCFQVKKSGVRLIKHAEKWNKWPLKEIYPRRLRRNGLQKELHVYNLLL